MNATPAGARPPASAPTDSIAGIGARVLGHASVAAMLHQVVLAQSMCASGSAVRGTP